MRYVIKCKLQSLENHDFGTDKSFFIALRVLGSFWWDMQDKLKASKLRYALLAWKLRYSNITDLFKIQQKSKNYNKNHFIVVDCVPHWSTSQ